jgi:hypothetical protein
LDEAVFLQEKKPLILNSDKLENNEKVPSTISVQDSAAEINSAAKYKSKNLLT